MLAGGEAACHNPLLGVPPHHATEILRGGLAVDIGFLPTGASLATTAEGVFAVGKGQAAFASGDFYAARRPEDRAMPVRAELAPRQDRHREVLDAAVDLSATPS